VPGNCSAEMLCKTNREDAVKKKMGRENLMKMGRDKKIGLVILLNGGDDMNNNLQLYFQIHRMQLPFGRNKLCIWRSVVKMYEEYDVLLYRMTPKMFK
jgi:hypothetical protein